MAKNKILLVGKIPPPTGGVSVHISRLLSSSETALNLSIDIFDYSRERNLFKILKKIYSANLIHLHLSNKKIRLLCILLLKILNKKTLVTYHGNYSFSNKYDRWSLKSSTASILLNEISFNKAKQIKSERIYKIGAFIPPASKHIKPLAEGIENKITKFLNNYSKVFCTNASSLAFDENGDEIYMGTELLRYFKTREDIGLIFSTPNTNYVNFLNKKLIF